MAYETRVRVISETDINVEKNTSKVTVAFEFRRTDYRYEGYNLTGSAYYTISCAGQSSGKVYITFNWVVAQNTWKEIGRKTFTVTHDADGSKTASLSGYFYTGIAPAEMSASGSAALTMIPRATTPTVSVDSLDAGNTITISTPGASTSFKHTLQYTFGNATGTVATDVNTSCDWEIPMELLEEIPDTISGICTITCQTYSGTTLIGSKTVTFTITVPEDVVPVISEVSISEAVEDIYEKFSAYVQNKSKLNIATAASGIHGSRILSCKVTVNGASYSGTEVTTNIITVFGSVAVSVLVTDSRGRTTEYIASVTVLEYYNPSILSFSAKRCTNTGDEDEEGTYLKLSIGFKIASVSDKNSNAYLVQLQKEGDTSWTDVVSGTSYEYNNAFLAGSIILDGDYSYTIRLTLADYFTSQSMDIQVGTAFTLVDYHRSGKGMAIGKVAEIENLFDVNMDTHIRGAFTYEIPDVNVDFNTVTTSGKWYCGIESTNRPEEINGWLEVMRYTDNFIYQRYITHIGVIWERWKDNGTWSDWKPKVQPKYANGYWGMTIANNDGIWIRTPSPGILPYQSGGASSLGTSSWPFSNIYANNIYDNGTLLENKFAAKSIVGNVTHMRAGSQVITFSNGTGSKLFTDSQVNSWFGVTNSNAGNTAVFASNGDGIACGAHVDGATHQNSEWYAVLGSSFTGSVRINYLVVYWG